MNPRVCPGLVSVPTGFRRGVLFLNMKTIETVIRDQFVLCEMPPERIEQMNTYGINGNKKIELLLGPEEHKEEDMDETHIKGNLTLEEAIAEFGEEETQESLKKELLQYVEKSTLKGVPVEKKNNTPNMLMGNFRI